MRIRLPFIVGIAVCTTALSATMAVKWLDARQAALREAETRVADTARTVGEVLTLRTQRERASLRARPQQDLATRLHETLAASGAGTGLLSEVAASSSDGAAVGASDGRYSLQQMRVSLRSAKLADLGKFLDRWRSTQPLWTVTSVDLSRATQSAPTTPGAAKSPPDERFNATIVLTSSYVSAKRTGNPKP
jgi:hypothetical protein